MEEALSYSELGPFLEKECSGFGGEIANVTSLHKITGRAFLTLNRDDWCKLGVSFGAAIELEQLRDRILKAKLQKYDFVSLAESVHSKIMAHGPLELGNMKKFYTTVPRPVLSLDQRTFHFMGRALAPSVKSFILESLLPKDGEPRGTDAPSFGVITGTDGSGKTTCVMAAVVDLHQRFAKARQKYPVPSIKKFGEAEMVLQEQDAVEDTVDEDDVSQENSIAEQEDAQVQDSFCRIVFVDCAQFVRDPFLEMRNSLLLAYIDDKQDVQDIMAAETFAHLELFMGSRSIRDRIYVVVDDANATDLDDDGDTAGIRKPSLALRSCARDKLWALQQCCTLFVCLSVRSTVRSDLRHDKRPVDLFICGGYEARELFQYLDHWEIKLSDEELIDLYWYTGFVPRLVHKYLFTGSKTFEEVTGDLKRYTRATRKYIRQPNQVGRNQLLKALFGEEIWKLSQVLDTRCFYRSPGGRGRCLVPVLRPYTMALLAKRLKQEETADTLTEIEKWTSRVLSDTNMARIGWSAEMATILAAALHRPHFNLGTRQLVIDPEVVVTGKFSWEILQQYPNKRSLVIPKEFNHRGVDLYYVDGEFLVVIQVSVATNAVKIHTKTPEVALQLYTELQKGIPGVGKLRTLLAWIVHGENPGHATGGKMYEEVVSSFAEFCTALKVIDERCSLLKKDKPAAKEDSCVECSEYQCYLGEGELDDWVQCDSCKCWVHTACAGDRYKPNHNFECLFCYAKGGQSAVGSGRGKSKRLSTGSSSKSKAASKKSKKTFEL